MSFIQVLSLANKVYSALNSQKQFTFKPNEKFDICYINLERESVRNEHIQKLLNTANCTYTRFNAVDGREVFKNNKKITDYTENLGLNEYANHLKFNELEDNKISMAGCKLSHYLNFRRIENLDTDKPILVLEDDIDFEMSFVSKIEEALEELPENWDILLITSHFNKHDDHVIDPNSKILQVGYFFECLGFLVNGANSAKKIADSIQFFCGEHMPVDLFIAYEAIRNNILVYALKRKLAIQKREVFESSIPTSQVIMSRPLDRSLMFYLKRQEKINSK